MPTAAQIAMLDKEIALFKSGAMSGDFMRRPGQPAGPGPQEQRIITSLTIAKMEPAEKTAYFERKRLQELENARMRAFIGRFKEGGDTVKMLPASPGLSDEQRIHRAHKTTYAELQRLSLDDENPDQWLNFFRVLPMRETRGLPLGKFRFRFDANGKMVYVPFTEQTWQNFFSHIQRGRWIPNQPFMYKCSPEWETHWINAYTNTNRQIKIGETICKEPKESLWMKIRTPVMAAVAIVVAVYLGPIVYGKIMGAMGGGAGAGTGAAAGGAGSGASAVAQATTFQKIQAGTKTLLGYVNKARTIKAVVNGEMPPPPIGIPGANFTDWAMIVAKEQIKKEAIDFAMEKGVEYIEKKMTQKEEAKLRAEIEAMQREMAALVPPEVKKLPPQPDPQVPATLKKIQQIEVKRAFDLQQLIIPGALIAGMLILGG